MNNSLTSGQKLRQSLRNECTKLFDDKRKEYCAILGLPYLLEYAAAFCFQNNIDHPFIRYGFNLMNNKGFIDDNESFPEEFQSFAISD